jgi:hypothetical protein
MRELRGIKHLATKHHGRQLAQIGDVCQGIGIEEKE